MNKADPVGYAEYLERFEAGRTVTGFGAQTTTSSPCPFCASPDWMSFPITGVQAVMEKGATCKACGRSAKAIFFGDVPNSIRFEIVQTGGDDPAPWLVPTMRRV